MAYIQILVKATRVSRLDQVLLISYEIPYELMTSCTFLLDFRRVNDVIYPVL